MPAVPAAPRGQDEVDRLIEQFDPESNFRRLVGLAAGIVTVIAVALSTASGVPWTYSPSIAAVAVLVIGGPLAAAGISAMLPTTIGTPSHARH